MGAGGSSVAISSYLMRKEHTANRPSKVIVSNHSLPRLQRIQKLHEKLDANVPREYVQTPQPQHNDTIVNRLKPYSLVINATGLGKDAPGSPITDGAIFPRSGIAWDFNYRGDLVFLDQARAQQQTRDLRVEDGWMYFIYGWTQVIAEVFHAAIPSEGKEFDAICQIAQQVR